MPAQHITEARCTTCERTFVPDSMQPEDLIHYGYDHPVTGEWVECGGAATVVGAHTTTPRAARPKPDPVTEIMALVDEYAYSSALAAHGSVKHMDRAPAVYAQIRGAIAALTAITEGAQS